MSDETILRPRKPRPEGATDCPWPGCRGYAKTPFWGCPTHWAGLPAGMQREWTRTDPQTREREHVAAKINEWIRRLHEHAQEMALPVEAAIAGFGAQVEDNGALTVRKPGLVLTLTAGEAALVRRVLNEQRERERA